jgi:hypothetical protein
MLAFLIPINREQSQKCFVSPNNAFMAGSASLVTCRVSRVLPHHHILSLLPLLCSLSIPSVSHFRSNVCSHN